MAVNSPFLFGPPTEGTALGCSHLRRGRGGTFRVDSQRVHRRAIRWVTAIGRAAHVRFLQTIHAPAYLCPHGAAVIVHSDGYATLDVGRSPAAAFSSACSTRAAFGIVDTPARRTRKASATCRGVAPRACAISASSRPPGLRAPGKRPEPKGL